MSNKLTYEQLEKQRNELAAQVERLRGAGDKMWEWISPDDRSGSLEAACAWKPVRDEAPDEAFKAKLKTEAITKFVNAVVLMSDHTWDVRDVKDFSIEYIKRTQEAGDE